MAQQPVAPWSRWDPPGSRPLQINQNLNNPEYDDNFSALLDSPRNLRGELIYQGVSANDKDFVDCVYGSLGSPERLTKQCLRIVGCCESDCCENQKWIDEYRWALALIIIFCAFVIIALVISLACWLINRRKDKKLKEEAILYGMSAANSQMSILGQSTKCSGYYPYVGGPNSPN